MEPHRLRAPRGDGAFLADPPLEEAASLMAANTAHLRPWDHDFQGRRAGRLRAMARSQLLAKAREHHARFGLSAPPPADPTSPWVVTGHQPELFHAGVWIKNFAVSAIARQNAAIPVNLIVDNDIPKGASVRVPYSDTGRLKAKSVEFDAIEGESPYEDWTIRSEALFASFADRARDQLGGLVADPILDPFWPLAMRAAETTDRAGLRFAAARRSLEESWGMTNVEVPLGAVCETEAFGWFASHLLAHLPRFQATHNAALSRYRALYKIRSKNHPVPRLEREGDWLEAPFWVWRGGNPRRRPLMARQREKAMELRIAGESEPLGSLRLSPDRDACCAVEDLQDLARRGIRIRTRALTTTMFSRLLLGDLFVHGIGGAKYDELGDEVIRGFFGLAAPRFLTLSMTKWLGMEAHPEAAAEIARIERDGRDLIYNPDRVLADSDDPAVRALIAAKQEAIAGPVGTRRERVARFRQIRKLNEELSPRLADLAGRLDDRRQRAEALARNNALATGREWSLVLHSQEGWLRAMRDRFPAAFDAKKTAQAGDMVAADGPRAS